MLFDVNNKYLLNDTFNDLCTDDEISYVIENRVSCRIVGVDIDNDNFSDSFFDIVFDNGLKMYGINGECLIQQSL